MSVIYLFYVMVSFIFHLVNVNNIQSLDDPYTKVYVEKETSMRCMGRNHTLVSLFIRLSIISIFVFLWSSPRLVIASCCCVQSLYSVYYTFAVKYKKRRYLIINSLSNLAVVIQIGVAGAAALKVES